MYKGIIQPTSDYVCSIWGSCSVYNKNIIFRLQKRATRIVERNFDFNESGLDIVKRLKWQVLEERRNYFLACIMYKCIHGYAPLRLCYAIDMVFERHPMNTRFANSMSVVLPKPNIEIFKNSLRYEGGKV